MSPCYRAFGLTIDSQLPLPELPSASGVVDVQIRCGRVPDRLTDAATESWFSATVTELLLPVPGVANFYVHHGREIVVEEAANGSAGLLQFYLLGSAMGALFHQRGILALHASSVEIAGQAVLLAGDPGAGKSTLAAAFDRRGYPLLADDICVVAPAVGNRPRIVSGPPISKLTAATLDALNIPNTELDRVAAERDVDKFLLPRRPAACEQLPLGAVFVLWAGKTDALGLVELGAAQRVAALVAMTYRYPFLVGPNQLQRHLTQCGDLAKQVPVSLLTRPLNAGIEQSTTVMIETILASGQVPL